MPKFREDLIDRRLESHYEPIKKIGRGLNGIVWSAKCLSHEFLSDIALKRVFNAFSSRIDAKRAYREVCYSLEFSGHPNIVSIHDIVASGNDMDIYLVMDKIDTDLSQVIQSGLQRIHIEFITWQCLRALKYIHSAKVMHRDIKPQNILINASCDIRICDFGLARSVQDLHPDPHGPSVIEQYMKDLKQGNMTTYCSSRWYRSPEQLLLARSYTTAADIWALACVVGEMIQRKPIFPGTCTLGQIQNILHITGRPLDADLECIKSKYAVPMLEGLGNSKEGPISEVIPNGSPESHDFLRLCLQFNPEKRISASEALEHPFVGHFHHPDAEGVHPSSQEGGIRLALSDSAQFSINQYRDQLYFEIFEREELQASVKTERFIRRNLNRGVNLS